MILDSVYKNTSAFTSSGNIEFNFIDNKSETRYLVDIMIDSNIILNNVFSIGRYKNIGNIINTSLNEIGIQLDSNRIVLILTGQHQVSVKIKQGVYTGTNNNVSTPNTYSVVPIGYSFGGPVDKLVTKAVVDDYEVNNFNPFHTTVLTKVNEMLHSVEEPLEDLRIAFSHDNDDHPSIAYIDKLTSANISNYVAQNSISNNLFAIGTIEESKLSQNVRNSLALADSSLQNIYLNEKILPKTLLESGGYEIDINVADTIKLKKKDNADEYLTYNDVGGLGTIDGYIDDIQPKIINPNSGDGKNYIVSYLDDGGYDLIDMYNFFKKEDNITLGETTTETDDLLYSSLNIETMLNGDSEILGYPGKIDKLKTSITPITDKTITMVKINKHGVVEEAEAIETSDLDNVLETYYNKKGVKRVINTPRSTIFFS